MCRGTPAFIPTSSLVTRDSLNFGCSMTSPSSASTKSRTANALSVRNHSTAGGWRPTTLPHGPREVAPQRATARCCARTITEEKRRDDHTEYEASEDLRGRTPPQRASTHAVNSPLWEGQLANWAAEPCREQLEGNGAFSRDWRVKPMGWCWAGHCPRTSWVRATKGSAAGCNPQRGRLPMA